MTEKNTPINGGGVQRVTVIAEKSDAFPAPTNNGRKTHE